MRLTTALLCDSAQVQGGKLFVLGGGFDTISAQSFPVIHRSLTVAMVAQIEPDERHSDLVVELQLIDANGNDLDVRAKGRLIINTPTTLPTDLPSSVPIVSPFYNIQFPDPESYAFVITLDDIELTRIDFRVVQATD